jgi:predicted PurR-regulated permease PerM
MPRWVPRLILLIILSLFAAALAFLVLERIRGLLAVLLIALFLSFALEPAVNWLTSHGWRRGVASVAVLLAALILALGVLALIVPIVFREVGSLVQSLPGWVEKVSNVTERWFGIDLSTSRVQDALRQAESAAVGFARNIAGDVLGVGAAIVGGLFRMLLIALFTFFFVADGPKLRRAVCSLLRPERQRDVLRAWEIAIDKTGGYFYSRLLLAAISTTLSYIVFRLLGLPGAFPLALWFGLASQFIPVAGTYIAALLPLFVALLERPGAALILLVYVVVYALIQDYLLAPRLAQRTMEVHPAITIAAVIVGASLMGAAGAFLALPAAATLQSGISFYIRRHEVVDSELTRTGPPPGTGQTPPGGG